MSACLINLEDTIRLAEWIPYHYTTLPLTGLVIALDPNNSQQGINRTLNLIDLWKDKIEITLWPDYFLSEDKRFRSGNGSTRASTNSQQRQNNKPQNYVRERQVYFANRCLAYHQSKNRSWTLLTDNDEYLVFNYKHDDEKVKYDHPGAKKARVKNKIDRDREFYMPLRNDLPAQNASTVLQYIQKQQNILLVSSKKSSTNQTSKANINNTITTVSNDNDTPFLPTCVRLPGIHYGGDRGVNQSFVESNEWPFGNTNTHDDDDIHTDTIDPALFSTLRDIHHAKRNSKFSKVMVDVSRVPSNTFDWNPSNANHAKTIHNPSRICGYNGKYDSGADYYSSLFRLNHYLGSLESYLERKADYRSRSIETYAKKAQKVDVTKNAHLWDRDVVSWVAVFVQSLEGGTEEAKSLLAPIARYVNAA